MIRIPKIQEMLGINLETYQQEVIDGAPVLPWIMDKIGKKSRDHCTKHNIKVLPPLSFEVRLSPPLTLYEFIYSFVQMTVSLFSMNRILNGHRMKT